MEARAELVPSGACEGDSLAGLPLAHDGSSNPWHSLRLHEANFCLPLHAASFSLGLFQVSMSKPPSPSFLKDTGHWI